MQSSIAFSLAVRSMILQGVSLDIENVLLFGEGVAGVHKGVKIILCEVCGPSMTLLDESL